MAQLALSLLGPLQATLDGVPVAGFESQKVRALLAYLALEADRPQARDALAGLLWPDQSDQDARNNLRQALANLRQALGDQRATPPYLRITRDTVQFNRASDHQIDVVAFTELLATCDQHPHRHSETCTSCARRLQQAAALYRGSFLDQFFLNDSAAFEEWALLKREGLHRRALQALAHLADYHERRGDYEQARHDTWRQLELDPWREEAHRQLMRALALSGQRSAALVQYATCRRILADELGVEPETETTELYARIQRGEAVTDARPGLPATNLAAHTPLTPLIGRETELAQLADRLEQRDCRLLTLVGPGGIGKTRLALQAAADLRASFPDGVVFVPLAALSATELLVPAIASALGFTFHGPADPKAQLLAQLHAKDLLLVLDNVEHLQTAAALVSELLATCPDLAVLATSRAPLHVRGEHQFPVPPLRLPDLAHLPDVGRLTQYAAVALFVARAQAVQPAFHMTAATALTVATICARLDGLPLAIELAAARVKLFSPQVLLARLDHRLSFLVSGARDLPARQQTLRNTIDWSYALLTAAEQRLFRCLSLFVGGCTVEAAEAVGNADGDLPRDVVDGLAALLDQNLLQREGVDGMSRFTMLETIHEYALERLDLSGEAEALRRQFADYYLALAKTAAPELTGPQQQMWLGRLEQEHDNLRAAIQWALDQREAEMALQFCGALWKFWQFHSHLGEGRRWMDIVLTQSHSLRMPVRAQVLCGAGWLAHNQADHTRAKTLFDEGLALAWALEEPYNIAMALGGVAEEAFIQGDYARARTLGEERLRLFQDLADKEEIAWSLEILGNIALVQGDATQAIALGEEFLALLREVGHTWGSAGALRNLGYGALMLGDLVRATDRFQEALALLQNLGDKAGIAKTLRNLGDIASLQGNHERAIAFFRESLTLDRDLGDYVEIALCLARLARVATAQAQPEQAARLCGAVKALVSTRDIRLDHRDQAEWERTVAAIRAQLDAAAFAAAWAAGQALTLEQAIGEALQTGARQRVP